MAIEKGARVAVIGDGGWGTTLAILLHNQGYKVGLWGPFADYLKVLDKKRENPKFLPGIKIPSGISLSADINQLIPDAALIILAIPSHFLRGVLGKINKGDISDSAFLSASKGIENDTLMRVSEVVEDVLGPLRLAVLSGPNISYEVARGLPATSVVSSREVKLAEEIQDVLMTQRFRVYTSDDVVGVELGGALKNIVAIACGISDGLGFGANTKAAILTRGLVEISRLGLTLGAKQETFAGLSGLGDLVTTCISSHGRNRRVGEQIGKGMKLREVLAETEMVAEGVRTTKSAVMLAERYKVEMPISEQIFQVLYEDKDPRTAVNDLMLRQKKAE